MLKEIIEMVTVVRWKYGGWSTLPPDWCVYQVPISTGWFDENTLPERTERMNS